MSRRRLPVVLSVDGIEVLNSCVAKWGFEYVDRVDRVRLPITRVSEMFRRYLGLFYSGKRDVFDQVARDLSSIADRVSDPQDRQSVREADRESLAMVRWMVGHMMDTLGESHCPTVPVLVRHVFNVPVPDALGRKSHVSFAGAFDLVSWDAETARLIVHIQNTTAAPLRDFADRVRVSSRGAGLVHALGWLLKEGTVNRALVNAGVDLRGPIQVGSVFWDVARRKVPKQPKITKDGTVSLAGIVTTAAIWEEALAAQGARYHRKEAFQSFWKTVKALELAGADDKKAVARWGAAQKALQATHRAQAVITERLRRTPPAFFERFETFQGPSNLERWRLETRASARTVRAASGPDGVRVRNQGNCRFNGCEYMDHCVSGHKRADSFATQDEETRQMDLLGR